MKIQLTLEKLKLIVKLAEEKKKYNSSLSETIVIKLTDKSDSHCGNDGVEVKIKNAYSECDSVLIGY